MTAHAKASEKKPVKMDRYEFQGVSQRYLKVPVHIQWACDFLRKRELTFS